MAVCYRHTDRETGVSCSSCGRPICPDCMTSTPVGMRCPECSRQKTEVRTLRNIHAPPTATFLLIGINVVLYLGMMVSGRGGSPVFIDLLTIGSGMLSDGTTIGVAHDEVWRLITGGFLHSPSMVLHILFNMYALYALGTMLEPVLGHARFTALYLASLLFGSFGVILLSPDAATVGASGAVFGLFGAAFVFQRNRGINPMQTGLGGVLLLNLAITFLIPGISIGGHLGGLAGGALAALAMVGAQHVRRGPVLPVLACALVGLVAFAGSVVAASALA